MTDSHTLIVDEADEPAISHHGLYVTDAELIRRLGVPKKMGYAAIHDLEKTRPDRPKFPAYDPLFPKRPGRRFWPAVEKYFMLRHGLADHPFMVAPHWQTEPATVTAANDAGDAARETLERLMARAATHRRPRGPRKPPPRE
jgi:hypothetical protein